MIYRTLVRFLIFSGTSLLIFAPVSVTAQITFASGTRDSSNIQLVDYNWAVPRKCLPILKPRKISPAIPNVVTGVDSAQPIACGEPTWGHRGPVAWSYLDQGEYIGPARTPHVPEYRLRVDDALEFVYRLTRQKSSYPYRFVVGDTLKLDVLTEEELSRELVVQPDGTISVPLVGQIEASDRTIPQLTKELVAAYSDLHKEPSIVVTPVKVNTRLDDLIASVNSVGFGTGGQTRLARIAPDGTVQLPGLPPVHAHGLTLQELAFELDQRYDSLVGGVAVTPVLTQRAPRFIYVLGEVKQAGRINLEGPTTVMQAISLAGGWNLGANLNQVVIFRRAEDWRLMSTMVDIAGALVGRRPISTLR